MTKSVTDLAGRWLRRGPEALSAQEHRALTSAVERKPVSRDLNAAIAGKEAVGDRLADSIARVGGSWTFIISFIVFLIFWTVGNSWLLGREGFDPYPFIFLNLVLSMIAALQAPVIMMSQNRQAERDRLDASHDYEVNLKAEIEIMALHEKFDELRHSQIMTVRDDVARLAAQLDRIEALVKGVR
ncbi:DUF1003 domain-containing protein [Mesorhizobium sp. WSM2239]|uniref:DUF1003 domain-containing protein n=2 Tax=unclassified Mesorhizobium TaxID=325217 RepID=A0AAU8D2G8_9HYPH